MKNSETCAAPGEPAKLEAPIRLTPEQLETVAAGLMARLSIATLTVEGTKGTTGYVPPQQLPPIKAY
jgi:hypothetical protein